MKLLFKNNSLSTICSSFLLQSWEHIFHSTTAIDPYFPPLQKHFSHYAKALSNLFNESALSCYNLQPDPS